MSEKRIKVLVANDDGIQANGLRTLVDRLVQDYDVTVVAPDRERSAMGHALTLHQPIRVDEVTIPGTRAAYAVSGTPSDCVKIALHALVEDKPDIIVSGINHGPNLGSDVLYSGTVSAALEGALNGYTAVATSLFNGYDKNADFRGGADFIARFLPRLVSANLPPKTILNVNIPAIPFPDVAGIQMTCLGVRMYTDAFEKRVDPRGNVYYWLAGEIIQDSEEVPESDVAAIRNNMISITPVTFDMTNWSVIHSHAAHFQAGMGAIPDNPVEVRKPSNPEAAL